MVSMRWITVLLLAACATPDREAPPSPAAPQPPPAAARRSLATAICAKSSRRIGVTLEGNTAFLKQGELEASERVLYWTADLAANVHALAVSDRAPKRCSIVGDCHALVLLDCGDGYLELFGGPSPSLRPEANQARFDAGQWLDLISLEPDRDVPDMLVRTRWQLTDSPESPRQEVDCPTVDANATRLSDATSTPMKGLDLQLGKRLAPMLLPGETFRIPLGPLATYNPLRAIGHVQPGSSAGIVFTTGECVLNEWFYAFGGLGVDLTLDPAPLVRLPNGSRRALLLVKALGTNQRTLADEPGDPPTSHGRDLVFAVDERRVTIVADTDTELGERVAYLRLEQQRDQIWLLTTSAGRKQQRRLFDVKNGEFEQPAGLDSPRRRPDVQTPDDAPAPRSTDPSAAPE
jgi:hypothetical protein